MLPGLPQSSVTGLASLDAETRERVKSCIHEAAHTVAARKNGFPVKWVSIDPDFIRNDPVAIDSGCNAGDPVCMAIASHVLEPIIAQKRLVTKSDKAVVTGFCIQILAGPYAEIQFDPDTFDHHSAGGDMKQIADLLAILVSSLPERKKLWAIIERGTNKFVSAHWTEIGFLAWHLEARRTILEHEIDGLISEGRAMAAEAVAREAA